MPRFGGEKKCVGGWHDCSVVQGNMQLGTYIRKYACNWPVWLVCAGGQRVRSWKPVRIVVVIDRSHHTIWCFSQFSVFCMVVCLVSPRFLLLFSILRKKERFWDCPHLARVGPLSRARKYASARPRVWICLVLHTAPSVRHSVSVPCLYSADSFV